MSTTYETERRQSFGEQREALDVLLDELALDHVKRGFELLQVKFGEDWVDHIDPKTLKLNDGAACVLGQLYGDYGVGLNKLGITHGGEYGFDENGASYRELDAAWLQMIEEYYAEREAR